MRLAQREKRHEERRAAAGLARVGDRRTTQAQVPA